MLRHIQYLDGEWAETPPTKSPTERTMVLPTWANSPTHPEMLQRPNPQGSCPEPLQGLGVLMVIRQVEKGRSGRC